MILAAVLLLAVKQKEESINYMRNIFKKNSFLIITVFAVVAFFAATSFVQAQSFIEPSDEAPKNNVLDFIAESGDSQARLGKLRIGSDVIPNQAADPMVDVIGNTYIQGNAYFDRQSSPAWQVVINQTPQHVNSGTLVTNGKLTIQNTAGVALYANSLLSDGMYIKTLSDSTRAVFGQTIQVAGGSVSSGVRGEATIANASAAGIYAKHSNCNPGENISVCGNAAQFVGNVVVTGVIRGDGRGIVRTWTLNDASSTDAAKGISLKTVDITNAQFNTSSPREYTLTEVLPVSTTFISMSVMVGNSPYDPTRAALDQEDSRYLAFSYNTESKTLTVKKGSADESIVVLFYFHQELSLNVFDADGNVVDPARALVGSSTPLTFRGSIGSGQFEGGEFLWTLHTGSTPTNANKCTVCGSVAESGPTTTYIPPSAIPASGNSIWLKATWTADQSIYAVQQIDLYAINFTVAPGLPDEEGGFYSPYVKIGNQTFTFVANTSCPGGCSPTPIAWSVRSGIGSESIGETTGTYTSPTTIDSGSSWTSVVRAAIASYPELYKEVSFPLLPQISISATVDGVEIATAGKASIGISKTAVLTATALGIPASIAHDFNWSLQGAPPTVFGETLTGGSAANQTATAQPSITYTAPNSVTIAGRTVTATWRSSSGATLASQTIRIYPGTASNVTFTQTENTTGTKSLSVSGFQLDRRIYSFCTTADCSNEQVVNYSALPYTIGGGLTGSCGTLQLTGPATSNTTCNPDTQICSLNSTFSYTASGTGLCTLKAKLMGDRRQTVTITLDPTAGGGGCVCNPKTNYCCVVGGEIGGEVVGGSTAF